MIELCSEAINNVMKANTDELKSTIKAIIFALIVLLILFFGSIAWSNSVAAAVFDNTNQQNTATLNGIISSPPTQERAQLEWGFVTSSNIVVCSVDILLRNSNATSGNATLLMTVSGTPHEGIPSYPIASFGTTTQDLRFNFEPCVYVYGENEITLRVGDPYSFSIGSQVWDEATRVHATGVVVNVKEIRNGFAADFEYTNNANGCGSGSGIYCVDPYFRINGEIVTSSTPPNPSWYGLDGTSTNPGDFGMFGNFFVSALTWLFVPTSEQMSSLATTSEQIAYKSPWGYAALSIDLLTGNRPGYSTSSVEIPIPGHASLTVFDINWYGDENFPGLYWIREIRKYMSWAITFLFAWFLYNRALRAFEML